MDFPLGDFVVGGYIHMDCDHHSICVLREKEILEVGKNYSVNEDTFKAQGTLFLIHMSDLFTCFHTLAVSQTTALGRRTVLTEGACKMNASERLVLCHRAAQTCSTQSKYTL